MPSPGLVLGPQALDTLRRYTVGPLLGPDGVALTAAVTLTGSEPLACRLWRGEGSAALATPTATWLDTAAGTITLSIAPADLATLGPGRYRIELTATIGGDVLACLPADAAIDLADAPGTPPRGLTRANLGRALARRCGKLLASVGLDADADLDDPIREGLASLGIVPADPLAVADADLAAVAPADLPRLLDVSELRALDNVLGNWTEPDQKAGTDAMDLGRLHDSIEARVARLADRCRRLHGYGLGSLQGGTIDLDVAQTDPTDLGPMP